MKQHGIRLFIVVNVALAVLLAWLWIGPDGNLRNLAWQVPPPVLPDLGDQVVALPDAKPVDAGLFVATLERPLFSPSRRPVPPAAPQADTKPEAPDPLANIHLYGIYTTEEGPGGMLARVEGKVRRIAINDTLGGWTLKSVQEREATLVRNGDERVIPLTIARPAAPAKPAAAQQPVVGAPSPSPGAGSAGGSSETQRQQMEEARRDLQRRRNEIRAKAGARPIP